MQRPRGLTIEKSSNLSLTALNLSLLKPQSSNNYGVKLTDVSNSTLQSLVVSNRKTGITWESGTNNSISCSAITKNETGILLKTSGVEVKGSTIQGNTTGLTGPSSGTKVKAQGNYWGAADGANPPGGGDKVTGQVDTGSALTAASMCIQNHTCTSRFQCESGFCDPNTKLCAIAKTWVVINTNDSGSGSLRWAMDEANKTNTHDRIHFKIGSGGKQLIKTASQLPHIIRSVTIDGRTQPGWKDEPVIAIDAGGKNGIVGGPERVKLYALAIQNAQPYGVSIGGTRSVFETLDVSRDEKKTPFGTGLLLSNCKDCFVNQVKASNRKIGLSATAGYDLTVTNSVFTDSGDCTNALHYGVRLGAINSVKLPGGVRMKGNSWGGKTRCALRIEGGSGVVISSKDEPATSIHLTDDSGLQHAGVHPIWLKGTVDTKILGVNLSNTSSKAYTGTGLRLQATVNTVVDKCDFTGRDRGVELDGTDIAVTNSTFKDVGSCTKFANAISFGGMTAKKFKGGVQIKGNTFGGTAKCILRMVGANNMTISGDPKSDASVILGGSDKFNEASGILVQGLNLTNVVFSDLDVSFAGSGQLGTGIHIYGKCTNNTFVRIRAENRNAGLHVITGNSGGITCSRFAGNKTGLMSGGTMNCKNNVFEGNGLGLEGPKFTATLDATKNWWGDPSGSKSAGGKGDTYKNDVDAKSPLTTYPSCAPTKKPLN